MGSGISREMLINDFAIRSFRDEGDADYVTARMAFRAALSTALWASQQTLEKYLKCVLLLHRIPGNNVKHDLKEALELIKNSGKVTIDLTPNTRDFISHLDAFGRYRYLEVSRIFKTSDIVSLDRAAWELRRYCTPDPRPRQLKLAPGVIPQKYNISGGYLEAILNDEMNSAREPLLWRNFFFGKRYRRVWKKPPFQIRITNAPLYLNPEILDEVLRYVYLPKALITGYRQWAKDRSDQAKG
jgi:HEPN domain-containing protein